MVLFFLYTFTYLQQTEKYYTLSKGYRELNWYWMTTNKMFKSFINPLKGNWGGGEKTSGSLSNVNSPLFNFGPTCAGRRTKEPREGILMVMCKGRHQMQILEKLLAVKIKDDPN